LIPDEVDLSNPSEPRVVATKQPASVSYEKMSKSKHNGVDPSSFISKYGADATRAHILFQAPVGDVLNWDEDKIAGVTRWLRRVHEYIQTIPSYDVNAQWESCEHFRKVQETHNDPKKRGSSEVKQGESDIKVWLAAQNTIFAVTSAFKKVYSLNTVVSSLMSFTNTLIENSSASEIVKQNAATRLLQMMAPITPALAEECWSMLYPSTGSIFDSAKHGWPDTDGSLSILQPNRVKCAVQVNGKVRCVVEIPVKPAGLEEGELSRKWFTEEILKNSEAQAKLTDIYDIRKAKKVFPVKNGRVVNYVIEKAQ
jgi:leucyl-tRNA synthetase